ncbi:MAG: hypothetical protein P1U46_02690 [Patescibacteria group bacterium]|nr:hypothetical protein [Patescibacteria group bacterium]
MVRKIIEDILIMPSVEVERPLLTNNPVSKYTLCHDLLLPDFKKTQIAGMVYFHDDIFAKPFDVEYTKASENYKVNHTPS